MDIKIIKVGSLEENCYIVSSNKTIVIDPGDEAFKIINYIESNNLDLSAILITHHHFDHVGAKDFLLEYKNVCVYDISNLTEGNHIISGFNIEVIYTPGHTSDSISYYFKDYNVMFVGDFIFKGTIGRTDLPTGNFNDMQDSLKKIKEYDNNVLIYPGHGDKTILKDELKNIYFRRI